MADGRMLHKKISLNEAVASLENDAHRLLFTWAISHLDIEGRISGSPNVFRAIVVPLLEHITSEKVSKFFKDAESKDLILRYQVGKEWFIQYPKFKDNQRLRADREAPSKLPPPPDELPKTTGELPEDSRSNDGAEPEDSGLKFKLSLREDKLRKDYAPPAPGNGDARPPTPAFSCECFEISPEYLAELAQSYPLLPEQYLLTEFFPRMRNWCLDNRKVPKHLKKFDAKGRLKAPRSCFANWLKKEDPAKAESYLTPAPAVYTPPAEPEILLTFDRNCPLCKNHPGSMLNPPGSTTKYSACTCLHPVSEVSDVPNQTTASPQ